MSLKCLPLGTNMPRANMKVFLETQMQGLTGHIEKAGFPFESPKWGEEYLTDNENPQWWVYEQTAYWLDGFVRTAVLLEEKEAIEKAKNIIYSVLKSADSDGYIGAHFMKETDGWNRWPHVVFFRACMALYDFTRDMLIPNAIRRHYLGSPCDYSRLRDVLNVEIMLWAYEVTQDKDLLALAEKTYLDYNTSCEDDLCDSVALSDKLPYAHGVSYNEYSKLGAILYCHTGKAEYLSASVAAYDKIDKHFMLPAGCPCSDEFMINDNYMRSYETCDVSDYTWSQGYMLSATGKSTYADRLEKCIFNAGLGSVLEDFRGLQYFSSANQTIADSSSNHNAFFCGSKWMSYRPNPGTECCPGNVNRFMPNYIAHQYYTDGEGGIYSMLFGASRLMYDGICIEQSTDFPFETKMDYSVCTSKRFTLYIRIPVWAKSWRVQGASAIAKDEFLSIDIDKKCELSVCFEAETELHFADNGVWFSHGALVYSLPVKTRREIDTAEERSDSDFPAYNMYADSEWRYGALDFDDVRYTSGSSTGWMLSESLPHLTVKAKLIKNWDYDRYDEVERIEKLYLPVEKRMIKGSFVFTPRIPDDPEPEGEEQEIQLYPYGLCKLRVTVLPKIAGKQK